MGTCNFCKKAVVLPYRCSFCDNSFCSEHKLPENHQCSNIASAYVHAKQRISHMVTTGRKERKCPKCGSVLTAVQAFDKETVYWECKTCSHSWTQPR